VQNIAFVGAALVAGFVFQIAWWRVRRPSISSVLVLFTLAFVCLSVLSLHWDILRVSPAQYARLTLLYVSVGLSYTIVCSAVEIPSPTLSLFKYMADRSGAQGCTEGELMRSFLAQDAMADRINLMASSGLVRVANGRCALTKKGFLFARLFEFAAKLFSLPDGG
jgi:hypothetical protein